MKINDNSWKFEIYTELSNVNPNELKKRYTLYNPRPRENPVYYKIIINFIIVHLFDTCACAVMPSKAQQLLVVPFC